MRNVFIRIGTALVAAWGVSLYSAGVLGLGQKRLRSLGTGRLGANPCRFKQVCIIGRDCITLIIPYGI